MMEENLIRLIELGIRRWNYYVFASTKETDRKEGELKKWKLGVGKPKGHPIDPKL